MILSYNSHANVDASVALNHDNPSLCSTEYGGVLGNLRPTRISCPGIRAMELVENSDISSLLVCPGQ